MKAPRGAALGPLPASVKLRVGLVMLELWARSPEERRTVSSQEAKWWREFFVEQGWLVDDTSWELSSKGRADLAAAALESGLVEFADTGDLASIDDPDEGRS